MAANNPYEPTIQRDSTTVSSLRPSNRAMWKAYLWSPSVAPIAFVALVLLIGIFGEVFGIEVNPASMLILPVIALTFGVVSCYVVAGMIGMPIAFYLRRVSRRFLFATFVIQLDTEDCFFHGISSSYCAAG